MNRIKTNTVEDAIQASRDIESIFFSNNRFFSINIWFVSLVMVHCRSMKVSRGLVKKPGHLRWLDDLFLSLGRFVSDHYWSFSSITSMVDFVKEKLPQICFRSDSSGFPPARSQSDRKLSVHALFSGDERSVRVQRITRRAEQQFARSERQRPELEIAERNPFRSQSRTRRKFRCFSTNQ